jgi:hypothetical protein
MQRIRRNLPFSIGNPGEDVPTIDVADLKSLWSIDRDMETRNIGAIGIRIVRDALSAGADIGAVLYRSSILTILEIYPGDLLARWKRIGEFDEVVFRVAATIPMKWVEGGVPQSHLPFDVDAFIQELQKESP